MMGMGLLRRIPIASTSSPRRAAATFETVAATRKWPKTRGFFKSLVFWFELVLRTDLIFLIVIGCGVKLVSNGCPK